MQLPVTTAALGVTVFTWKCVKCNHTWHSAVRTCFVCGTPRSTELTAITVPKKVDQINVHSKLPTSIAYLHALAANGQGDVYDWVYSSVTVQVCGADSTREPGLTNVEKVTLEYIKSEART